MKYYFNTTLKGVTFDQAIDKVTDELKKEGFGVLTEIDIAQTLKKKLDVDFKKYKILGACNPPFAYKALTSEDKIGLFLPFNVVVEEHENGDIEVSAVDPIASMMSVENEKLGNKVIFIPKQPYDELLQYTAASDLGITFDKDTNINYRYSLPNKLFDYIICRVPVLASDLPEIRKVIDQYDIGSFIENHDPIHIAQKMMEALKEQGRYQKWITNLNKAAEELNWPQERKVMLKLIDDHART